MVVVVVVLLRASERRVSSGALPKKREREGRTSSTRCARALLVVRRLDTDARRPTTTSPLGPSSPSRCASDAGWLRSWVLCGRDALLAVSAGAGEGSCEGGDVEWGGGDEAPEEGSASLAGGLAASIERRCVFAEVVREV